MEGSQHRWTYDTSFRSRLARLLKETATEFFVIETGFEPGIHVEDTGSETKIQLRMQSSDDPIGAEITITTVSDGR